jgi:hypothetical protein
LTHCEIYVSDDSTCRPPWDGAACGDDGYEASAALMTALLLVIVSVYVCVYVVVFVVSVPLQMIVLDDLLLTPVLCSLVCGLGEFPCMLPHPMQYVTVQMHI